MTMRLRGMSLLAAAALAGSGLVAAAPAYAAPSSDTTKFCAGVVPSTLGKTCYVTVATTIDEGQKAKATFFGTPNTTIAFRAFAVVDGKPTPVGPSTPVTTGANGMAEVSIPVDKLKAPLTGGKYYTVQPADWTDPAAGIPSSSEGSKVSMFTVNSARGEVTMGQLTNLTQGQSVYTPVRNLITGHEVAMQLLIDGQWKTMNPQKAVANDSHLAQITWTVPGLPVGKYPARVMNLTANEAIWEGTYQVGGDLPPATSPKPSTTTKPSTPAKPAPVKDKDSQGGLAKTGL